MKRAVEQVSNAGGNGSSPCASRISKGSASGRRSRTRGESGFAVRLPIPKTVGELDCLGYSQGEELLLVAECKLVRSGSEPAFFRDDVSKFIDSSNSYADQLPRKAKWVRNNCDVVCRAMESEKGNPATIRPLESHVLITHSSPAIVTYMIHDFPCASITELMTAHEAVGAWPYRIGICNLH